MYIRDKERVCAEILSQWPDVADKFSVGDVMSLSILLEADGETRSQFRILSMTPGGFKVRYIEPWKVDRRHRTTEPREATE